MHVKANVIPSRCVSGACDSDLEVHGVGSKHVAVKRFAHFVDGRLPPASGVITKRTVLRKREKVGGKHLIHG